jgi:hypothetical protein
VRNFLADSPVSHGKTGGINDSEILGSGDSWICLTGLGRGSDENRADRQKMLPNPPSDVGVDVSVRE